MNRKILLAVLCILIIPAYLEAQSLTTEGLHKKHSGSLELFFYNNTLRMLNQNDDKEFDEMIRDIEKMRFLMIKKEETNFGTADFKKLVSDYKAEAFQEIMTSRHEGKNFDVYLKENHGKTKGMLVLVNDAENLYVLDILGAIALDKVTKLYSKLDGSVDIGSKIKAFAGHNKSNDDDGHDKSRPEDH
jgi:hypothetical protein